MIEIHKENNPSNIKLMIAQQVWAGFQTKNQIIEMAEHHCDWKASELHLWIEAEWTRKLREENEWDAVTDYDRLERAFARLEDEGFISAHCPGYDQEGCLQAVEDRWRTMGGKASGLSGAVFYDGEALMGAIIGEGLEIQFRPLPGNPHSDNPQAAAHIIAASVLNTLNENGLTSEWSGSLDDPIIAKLTWQKRAVTEAFEGTNVAAMPGKFTPEVYHVVNPALPLAQIITNYVEQGFLSRDEIIETLNSCGEFPDHDILTMVDKEWQRKVEVEATWPEITDCDRLVEAFKALNGMGIISTHRTGTTNTDAADYSRELWKRMRQTDNAIHGCAFYTISDIDHALENGVLNIGFDAYPGKFPAHGIALDYVAMTIVQCLRNHNLNASWSGNSFDKISIELTWNNRAQNGIYATHELDVIDVTPLYHELDNAYISFKAQRIASPAKSGIGLH